MGWVRVSDDFYDNEKFQTVTALGVAVWIATMAYCNRNLTDGMISKRAIRGLVGFDGVSVTSGVTGRDAGPEDGVTELLDAGILHAAGHDCDRCPQPAAHEYVVHDYLAYQPSREKVEADREAAKARKAKFKKGSRELHPNSGKSSSPPNPNPKSQEDTNSSNDHQVRNVTRAVAPDDQSNLGSFFEHVRIEPVAIRTVIEAQLGLALTDQEVFGLYSDLSQMSTGPIRNGQAYILAAIRDTPFEVQKLIHARRAA